MEPTNNQEEQHVRAVNQHVAIVPGDVAIHDHANRTVIQDRVVQDHVVNQEEDHVVNQEDNGRAGQHAPQREYNPYFLDNPRLSVFFPINEHPPPARFHNEFEWKVDSLMLISNPRTKAGWTKLYNELRAHLLTAKGWGGLYQDPNPGGCGNYVLRCILKKGFPVDKMIALIQEFSDEFLVTESKERELVVQTCDRYSHAAGLLPQILEMTTSSTVLHTLSHIQRSRRIPRNSLGGIISAVVDVVISRELTDVEICLSGELFADGPQNRMLTHAKKVVALSSVAHFGIAESLRNMLYSIAALNPPDRTNRSAILDLSSLVTDKAETHPESLRALTAFLGSNQMTTLDIMFDKGQLPSSLDVRQQNLYKCMWDSILDSGVLKSPTLESCTLRGIEFSDVIQLYCLLFGGVEGCYQPDKLCLMDFVVRSEERPPLPESNNSSIRELCLGISNQASRIPEDQRPPVISEELLTKLGCMPMLTILDVSTWYAGKLDVAPLVLEVLRRNTVKVLRLYRTSVFNGLDDKIKESGAGNTSLIALKLAGPGKPKRDNRKSWVVLLKRVVCINKNGKGAATSTTTHKHEYMEILANIHTWYSFNGEPDVMCEEEIYFHILDYGLRLWAA
jgi:hypothetical protein